MSFQQLQQFWLFCALSFATGCSGQTCRFGGIPDGSNLVEVLHVDETLPPGSIIWETTIENVEHAVSPETPHRRYLTGLKYPSRYVYQTSDVFSEFIATERTLTLERNTTFYCADGSERNIFFKFILLDLNTNPPEFQSPPYTLTLYLSSRTNDSFYDPVNDKVSSRIEIRDKDLSLENAQVHTSTSVSSTFFTSTHLDEDFLPDEHGFVYYAIINVYWQAVRLGNNTFEIIADDNRYATRVPVTVMVYP